MKLSKSERNEVRNLITFDDGLIHDKDQLENDLIDFMNKKYRQKYKSDESYNHIRLNKYFNLDRTEVDRTIPEDNTVIERVSIVLYGESIKDRRERGVKVKNDSKNIEPIGSRDIGEMRQYNPFYQMNGQKIYINKVSLSDTREDSKGKTISYQCEQVYAQKYTEVERTIDTAINSLFDKYRVADNKNEILFLLLINLNKEQLDWYSREALTFFLDQELRNYKILPKQQQVLDHIILAGEIPDANQKKLLKRMLRINNK